MDDFPLEGFKGVGYVNEYVSINMFKNEQVWDSEARGLTQLRKSPASTGHVAARMPEAFVCPQVTSKPSSGLLARDCAAWFGVGSFRYRKNNYLNLLKPLPSSSAPKASSEPKIPEPFTPMLSTVSFPVQHSRLYI